jgi:hypothetical protein
MRRRSGPLDRRAAMSTMKQRVPGAMMIVAVGAMSGAVHANPLSFVTDTFSSWKNRLFGSGHSTPRVVDAPASGDIALEVGHPMRIGIVDASPERDFPKGNSHYRLIELPQKLEHAAVRVQVLAESNEKGRGNAVFKPVIYVMGDSDADLKDPVEAKPLHLDIRPFRRTRLLGCMTLDNLQKFALATTPESVGKSYETEVREAVKAPTQGGFYYSTDAVKVKLPYAATGSVILEITAEDASGKGC